MRFRRFHASYGVIGLASCLGVLLPSVGCNTFSLAGNARWFADYEKAEAQCSKCSKPMLIWYKEARPGFPDPLRKTFRDATVRKRLHDYVICSLVRSYEPDRRYVAQYGVERAPAVILIHRNGTYHALVGRQSPDQLLALLDTADSAGSKPALDPHIPRRPRYHWLDDFGAASAEAFRTKRPMLVVFYRRWSFDLRRLDEMLQRREVYSRTTDMIHCRLSMPDNANRTLTERFGIREMPALVFVRADGDFGVLELPRSYEAVVQFVDEWSRKERTTVGAGTSTSAMGLDTRNARTASQALAAPAKTPKEPR